MWHFEHGLHCKRRFSGRHESILWYTMGDNYIFNLDAVRVPQKYPGKQAYRGERRGQYTCNPLGKNPGDVWIIPNVKSNHVEKTNHPCQFPIEIPERLILAFTNEEIWWSILSSEPELQPLRQSFIRDEWQGQISRKSIWQSPASASPLRLRGG